MPSKLDPLAHSVIVVALTLKSLITLLAGGFCVYAAVNLLIPAYRESQPVRLDAGELPGAFDGQRWITLIGRPAVEIAVNDLTIREGVERYSLHVPIVSPNHTPGDPVYASIHWPPRPERYSKEFLADLANGPHEFTGLRTGWTTDKPHRGILAPGLCGEPFLQVAIDEKPDGPALGWVLLGLGLLFLVSSLKTLISRWRGTKITAKEIAGSACDAATNVSSL